MSTPAWDRRLARLLARSLAPTPVTPNQVTTLGFLSGMAAAFLYAQGDEPLADWAAVLFILGAFLDHVDGELARMTESTSRFGHYYDYVASGVAVVSVFAGIGLGLRHGPLGDWAIALGGLSAASVFTILGLRLFIEARYDKPSHDQPSFAGFEIEDILYLIGPITWAGGLVPFLVAAGAGAPLFLLWQLWQWRRLRSGADTGAGRP